MQQFFLGCYVVYILKIEGRCSNVWKGVTNFLLYLPLEIKVDVAASSLDAHSSVVYTLDEWVGAAIILPWHTLGADTFENRIDAAEASALM